MASRLIHLVVLMLLAVGFTAADWIEDQTNGTASYRKVTTEDLTLAELGIVNKLLRESNALARRGGSLKPRECTPPSTYKSTKLVGNGNPHQNYYYQQVTGAINCAGGTITRDTSTSTTWEVSVSGSYDWISGGFAVSKTYSVGQMEGYPCEPGDKQVCIYNKVAYTVYTVQPELCVYNCGNLDCKPNGNTVLFFSPNNNQFGGCYYKGVGNRVGCANEIPGCAGEHTGFWHKCGGPGGPPNGAVCNAFQERACGQTCSS